MLQSKLSFMYIFKQVFNRTGVKTESTPFSKLDNMTINTANETKRMRIRQVFVSTVFLKFFHAYHYFNLVSCCFFLFIHFLSMMVIRGGIGSCFFGTEPNPTEKFSNRIEPNRSSFSKSPNRTEPNRTEKISNRTEPNRAHVKNKSEPKSLINTFNINKVK